MISTNNAIKELKTLAREHARQQHPDFPEYARTVRNYNPASANGLCRCILDFLKFKGWQAERISCTGRYVDTSKIVTDVLGNRKRIGSGHWISSSMQPGTSDVSAIIQGRSVKIEIKIGRDKMSEAQLKYKAQVEAAQGLYWTVGSFEQFLNLYNQLIQQ